MAKFARPLCDTRCQIFYKEIEEKAERVRSKWFIQNKKKLFAGLDQDEFSVKKKETPVKFTDFKKSHQEADKKKPFEPWRPTDNKEENGLMRPIKPAIRNILYVPKDESFHSKEKYLNERYKEKPEDRYYYPYCSSWEFGWRQKDYTSWSPSQFGTRSVIQTSFYRRNASSLQRDPDWYRICQTGDPKNFNEIMIY